MTLRSMFSAGERFLPAICSGRLLSAQLPVRLDLSDLEVSFGRLRANSLEAGKEVEWGGCIVFDGKRAWLEHLTSGDAEGVAPCCPPGHAGCVGFAHSHLPDLSGFPGPYFGFSASDYRAGFECGDRLALVTNGPEVFALVRTADRTPPPRRIPNEEFSRWEAMYVSAVRKAVCDVENAVAAGRPSEDALDRRLLEVNRKLCGLLGFALYRGLWGRPLSLIFDPGLPEKSTI